MDEMREVEVGQFTLLPPRPGTCPTCARAHAPNLPHDQQSLYYQHRFFAEHGYWPTWEDAAAHCDERTRTLWMEALANVTADREETP